MKKFLLIIAALGIISCSQRSTFNADAVADAQGQIARVEPLSWWVGMKTPLQLLIGGQDISKYNLKDWRRYVGYVPQDSTLLNRSIIDNISCMEDEPDINRIAVLMSDLGMDDYLSSMPLGLMTKIGERGALLSGGQRQKIAIARALYARPAILLMDEATSSLDKESEKLVLRKVDELRKERNMIVIMITHKPSNYIIADKIVDIKSGHSGGGSPHLK
jgi:ATP-binding cassette subfamily B protein